MWLTILESMSALAMNLPRNLNLALTLLTVAALVWRPSGIGKRPLGANLYSVNSSPPENHNKTMVLNYSEKQEYSVSVVTTK